MFEELAVSLAAALGDLGHSCSAGLNQVRPGAVNILLGATMFAARVMELPRHLAGQPYILYQLEQLDDRHGLLPEWPEYRELMAKAERIWDYSPSSSAWLGERGLATVTTLQPGYHPCLEVIPSLPRQDIDVMFVGTPHPRRQRVLDTLKRSGASVVHLNGVYGVQRNHMLARAKVVLNIHGWDGLSALETVRLSFLLANRRFVVSEKSDHDPYGGGVIFSRYDDLADTCLYHLRQSDDRRRAVAERGYQALRAQSMAEALRPLVGSA